jgi:hypothetical protein
MKAVDKNTSMGANALMSSTFDKNTSMGARAVVGEIGQSTANSANAKNAQGEDFGKLKSTKKASRTSAKK